MPRQEMVESLVNITPAVAFVDDRIIEIVTERPGIKETDLALDIMMDLTDRASCQDPMADDIDTASIFFEINRMVRSGRINAIDCAIGDRDYTFLVPVSAKVTTQFHFQIDRRYRH